LALTCACVALCNFDPARALFDFTNPATEADDPLNDIENTEDRLEELADYVNSSFPSPLPTPTNGSVFKAIIIDNGGTSYNSSYVIRSNNGDILLSGVPSAGQYLQFQSSSTASPVSLGTSTRWTLKTSNFSTADGGKYIVTSGVNKITVHNPANGDEFWIKPEIGTSLVSSSITMNGGHFIAGAAASSYRLNENVVYHFMANSNGTAYDVGGELLDR
jgi:hypothetical protein